MRNSSKSSRAGHKPIITVGFETRGKVDLVDMQSNELDGMKWPLTYCDHGTKYAVTRALPNKQVTILHLLLVNMCVCVCIKKDKERARERKRERCCL